ncbi:MAG: VacJ family lipoprotein [Piscirickettsiaceae bacterium]|nr:VacJ family lipoprotein [Piscirickettsiaceae bacterium]
MTKFTFIRVWLLASVVLLSGCATTSTSNVNDPLEGYNRVMYSFNDTLDKVILKPAAIAYDSVTPDPIQKGVSNFFSNLNDITVIINDLLQLKFGQAFDDTGRFLLNSTVGVAGIFDIAGYAGHEKHNEDFGQTLAVWGVDSGPYFVLPLFGPRTIRDTVGLVGDVYTNPITYLEDTGARNALFALQVVDSRANLLGTKEVLDEATDDEYIFVRDAYLQRRQNLIYDGNPPEEDFDVFTD